GAREGDGAAVGRVDARHHVEQRGLAGSVGADQPDDLALGDRKVDAVERDEAAEAARQCCAGKQRRHGDLGLHPGTYSRSGRGSRPWGRNRRIRMTSTAYSANRYSWITCSFSGRITTKAAAMVTPQALPTPPRRMIETRISESPKVKLLGAMKPSTWP